nr:unnamed protein product [Callosobruchus analis]
MMRKRKEKRLKRFCLKILITLKLQHHTCLEDWSFKSSPKRKLSSNYDTPSDIKRSITDEISSNYSDDDDLSRFQDIEESSFNDYLE